MFSKGEKSAIGGGNLSFIGSDVTITGNIGGQGNLHVDGRIDGDIECGILIVGQSGQIYGNVTAADARVAGIVHGSISATALTIEATARIDGDMSYDAVSIATGAAVEGRVKRLSRSDSPLKLIASE